VTKIEFFTVRNHQTILSHLIKFFVHILNEILGCCFEKQDLIVVVSMMGQIAALLAHQFVVNAAECNILLQVIGAYISLLSLAISLAIALLLGRFAFL
jgi:hypothetical protein